MSRNLNDIRVKRNAEPLYVTVKNKIRSLVDSGHFPPNSKLPREIELAEMLNVSRNTLREALKSAQIEGWVIQKHGIGTFIAGSAQVEQGLEILESVISIGKRLGWETGTVDFQAEIVSADSKTASALHVSESVPLHKISRVITWNNRRVAYIEDYIPVSLLAINDLEANFTGSVLDYMINAGKPEIEYAWTNISSMLITDMLAEKLKAASTEVIFLAEETVYSTDCVAIDYSLNYMLTNAFRYHIIRTLPKNNRIT